jgi:hypothetical protein
MRALTRDQLLTLMGMTSGGFDAQQRAGYVALAFGSPNPAMPGRYCDLDLVGMAIANGLAPALGRPTATTVTLGFFDQWVAAVGQADADASQNYFLAIGLFGWNEQKKHPQEIVVTHGTSEQIMFDLRDAGLVIAVNITDMIARLRAKGLAAGIDLSQPFFFPPITSGTSRSLANSKLSAKRDLPGSDETKRSGGTTTHLSAATTSSWQRD